MNGSHCVNMLKEQFTQKKIKNQKIGQTTFLEPDSKTTEVAEDFKKHKNATL